MAAREIVVEIPINKLVISKFNIRREIGDISELVASIKELGVLEPIIVRPRGDKYEIIVGRRRFEAAKQAGLKSIPAIIKEIDDTQALAVSLIENIQRGELSIREEGEAYLILQQRLNNIREVARLTGISHRRIIDTLEAYSALQKLAPAGVKVVGRLSTVSEERLEGRAIPKRHAIELERVFKVVKLPENVKKEKYVKLAKAIAPLEQNEAKKVLEYFKMYPEKSVDEIVDKALSRISLEATLPVSIARRVDELAEKKGIQVEEVLSRVIEKGIEMEYGVEKRGETRLPLELPLGSLSTQLHNKLLWNLSRLDVKKYDFYTIGYSERSIEQFIAILKKAGVKLVVDVRSDPVSQFKPEFSKKNIEITLNREEIEYIHVPELGVPRKLREELSKSGDWNKFFRWYDKNVVSNLDEIIDVSKLKMPFAFMCMELDPTKCHRHRLAIALEKKGLKSLDL